MTDAELVALLYKYGDNPWGYPEDSMGSVMKKAADRIEALLEETGKPLPMTRDAHKPISTVAERWAEIDRMLVSIGEDANRTSALLAQLEVLVEATGKPLPVTRG